MSHPQTLRGYLAVIRRWKWIVILTAALVPSAALAFSLQQEKLYRASADVLLSRQDLGAALAGIPEPFQSAERHSQTQADLARLPDLAERVVAGSGMTAMQLLENSSVDPKANADLLVFEVTNSDPEATRQLATAYAREFTTFRQELDTETLRSARSDLEERIAELEAETDTDPDLRAALLETEAQLRTLEALQGSNASLVQPAQQAEQVQPRTMRNVILGAAVGIVLGVALAFLLEALDRRIRSEDEIQNALRVPLLARVPAPTRSERKGGSLAMISNPGGAYSEVFRTLRTNVEFAMLDQEMRTIMVTSTIEGEGKTTTISNLAIAFARAGHRTALVDLDLRRPDVHRLFGLEGRAGLTDLLLGRVEIEQALVPVPVVLPSERARAAGNGKGESATLLHVLPAGTVPPNPGEVVGSEPVSRVLAEVARRVDIVLVDSPPLLPVTDALTLSAKVDGLVLVTHLGRMRRPLLRELGRILPSSQATVLGFVATNKTFRDDYEYLYGASAYLERGTSEAVQRERSARL